MGHHITLMSLDLQQVKHVSIEETNATISYTNCCRLGLQTIDASNYLVGCVLKGNYLEVESADFHPSKLKNNYEGKNQENSLLMKCTFNATDVKFVCKKP